MKKCFILIILLILIAMSFVACQQSTPYPPKRLPLLIPISRTINTIEEVDRWLRNYGFDYLSDEETTGYSDYRFTPAELLMAEIPDVASKTPRTIQKIPKRGDCDDYAILTAYLMSRLGFEAHYVELYTANAGHAISYGIDSQGRCHIFDLWFYRGTDYASVDEYIAKCYPKWWKWKDIRIENYLEILFLRGHVKYHPDVIAEQSTPKPSKKSTPANACPVEGICK